MGIKSVPAAATRAEPIPKVIIVIRLLFTPMRVAASLSWAVARMHRPRSVFNRNKKSAMVNATAKMNAMLMAQLKEIFPIKKTEPL